MNFQGHNFCMPVLGRPTPRRSAQNLEECNQSLRSTFNQQKKALPGLLNRCKILMYFLYPDSLATKQSMKKTSATLNLHRKLHCLGVPGVKTQNSQARF